MPSLGEAATRAYSHRDSIFLLQFPWISPKGSRLKKYKTSASGQTIETLRVSLPCRFRLWRAGRASRILVLVSSQNGGNQADDEICGV